MEKLFDLSKFGSEDDSNIHQSKCSRVLGTCYGLRGSKEKTDLTLDDFETGFYPEDHCNWPGQRFCGLKNLKPFKHNNLGLKNDYLYDFKSSGRLPVLSDGANGDVGRDAGGTLYRWLEKCKADGKCQKFFRQIRHGKISSGGIGRERLTELDRMGFKLSGVSNWESLKPHAMRHWFITVLSQAGVMTKEIQHIVRHKDASTTIGYQTRNKESENHRLNALFRLDNQAANDSNQPAPSSNFSANNSTNHTSSSSHNNSSIIHSSSTSARTSNQSVQNEFLPYEPRNTHQMSVEGQMEAAGQSFQKSSKVPAFKTTGLWSGEGEIFSDFHCDGQHEKENTNPNTNNNTKDHPSSGASPDSVSSDPLVLKGREPVVPSFTQLQAEQLHEDINRLQNHQRRNDAFANTLFSSPPTLSNFTSPGLFFSTPTHYANTRHHRQPSANEIEVIKLRKRVKELEQAEKNRELYLQRQEQKRFSVTSPYSLNSTEENKQLYSDYLSHVAEVEREEKMKDMIQRRKYVLQHWEKFERDRDERDRLYIEALNEAEKRQKRRRKHYR